MKNDSLKFLQKGFAPALIILLITAITVVLVVLRLTNINKFSPTATKFESVRIYENKDYKYKLEYPIGWETIEKGSAYVIIKPINNDVWPLVISAASFPKYTPDQFFQYIKSPQNRQIGGVSAKYSEDGKVSTYYVQTSSTLYILILDNKSPYLVDIEKIISTIKFN